MPHLSTVNHHSNSNTFFITFDQLSSKKEQACPSDINSHQQLTNNNSLDLMKFLNNIWRRIYWCKNHSSDTYFRVCRQCMIHIVILKIEWFNPVLQTMQKSILLNVSLLIAFHYLVKMGFRACNKIWHQLPELGQTSQVKGKILHKTALISDTR